MRQTPLDKAIENLKARIAGHQEVLRALEEQRASLRIPAKKPKPAKPVEEPV